MLKIATCLACISIPASGLALAEADPPVAIVTDNMPAFVARQLHEEAAKGVHALRRYVERTRMIHAIDFRSIIRDDDSRTGHPRGDPRVEVAEARPREAAK